MKATKPILVALALATLNLSAAVEKTPMPEPGPEDAGLRLRLTVAPRDDTTDEGYNVRVDVLNAADRAVTLQAVWDNEETGNFEDYLDAATSIECVPAVQQWLGQIIAGRRKSPQPQYELKPGAYLSVHWQTKGRHLKNRVSNLLSVQNPEFPFPGLYSVHATLALRAEIQTVRLRSNEQLVSVGGSNATPKSTLGRLLDIQADGKTAMLSLGSFQKIEPGDQFEYRLMGEQGKLTINKVQPDTSIGSLDVLWPTNGTLPPVGRELTLIKK
jgi:hypothetical protein